ncbi:MAG: YkgJ family cysteine cluster protein [bacterium]|nr:YkgJ family cysteine cluster protein [bacterium]
MIPELLQITPPAGLREAMLPKGVRARLNTLYDQIPGVSCEGCDHPGKCCELTQSEWDADYATMYPLYAVEYLNIVDYVRTHFGSERQRELLSIVDERPMRCPFLTDSGGCSIHPVRPLTCRTYGVLNNEVQVEAAAEANKADLPKFWVSAFLSVERYTVCDLTKLREPDKMDGHLDAMVSLDYERRMVDMAHVVGILEGERQEIFEALTEKEFPVRWTWGGFNLLLLSPVSWLREHFAPIWKNSFLGE